ncbi:hypothetical protein BC829DRAFT_245688 [Chytridium lagenaria]|nr:hypothetical protein BC829DRAFT_245688 [Chytridium lagenaria]
MKSCLRLQIRVSLASFLMMDLSSCLMWIVQGPPPSIIFQKEGHLQESPCPSLSPRHDSTPNTLPNPPPRHLSLIITPFYLSLHKTPSSSCSPKVAHDARYTFKDQTFS